jgi:hypothetical protein
MIYKTEFLNYLTEKMSYTYNKDNDILTDDKGNEINADQLFTSYKKKTGQSLECIHDEHVSCFSLLRCTECGTYIFEYYDEAYEPNLKCPVCTNYKTGFKYYTADEVKQDEHKQKEIDMYIKFAQLQREADERYEKRGGLNDWEKTHKKIIFNNKQYKITIQLVGFSKGDLEVEINIWKRANDYGYILKKCIKIPLSPHSFYIQFIYKHLGKCHKDLRSKFYIGKARESK